MEWKRKIWAGLEKGRKWPGSWCWKKKEGRKGSPPVGVACLLSLLYLVICFRLVIILCNGGLYFCCSLPLPYCHFRVLFFLLLAHCCYFDICWEQSSFLAFYFIFIFNNLLLHQNALCMISVR